MIRHLTNVLISWLCVLAVSGTLAQQTSNCPNNFATTNFNERTTCTNNSELYSVYLTRLDALYNPLHRFRPLPSPLLRSTQPSPPAFVHTLV